MYYVDFGGGDVEYRRNYAAVQRIAIKALRDEPWLIAELGAYDPDRETYTPYVTFAGREVDLELCSGSWEYDDTDNVYYRPAR